MLRYIGYYFISFSISPSSHEKIYEKTSSKIILNDGNSMKLGVTIKIVCCFFKIMHSQPLSSPNQIVLTIGSRLVITIWRSSTIFFINVLPMSVLRCGHLTTNHSKDMSRIKRSNQVTPACLIAFVFMTCHVEPSAMCHFFGTFIVLLPNKFK